MADINVPITKPSLSVADNSKTDDSFKQQGTHVHLEPGAVYNQNCGNKKEMSRMTSTVIGIVFSAICDLLVIGALVLSFQKMSSRLELLDRESKEGTIWILRNDIIKSIDIHEATGTITPKSYKRLRDQFDYYTSIGGNHDVKDRIETFNVEIMSGKVVLKDELPPSSRNSAKK